MAANPAFRDLPDSTMSKTTSASKRRKPTSAGNDDSDLIISPTETPKSTKRKPKSSTTKQSLTGKRRKSVPVADQGDEGVGNESRATHAQGQGVDDDAVGENINTNNSHGERNSRVSRRKKKRRQPNNHTSNDLLQSGRSLPQNNTGSGSAMFGSGERNVSEANINSSTGKARKKRRRKQSAGVSSTKIESLGVDLADIEDDIVDNDTDAETDSTTQVAHKNHMKSQPIGKLFIEQTHRFASVVSKYSAPKYSVPKNVKNQPAPVDMLYQHLYFTAPTVTPDNSEKDLDTRQLKSPINRYPESMASNGGFKSAGSKVMEDMYMEEQRNKQRDEDEEGAYPVQISAIAFALTSIQVFKSISHFCMGILAGLAIWQTLYVYNFTNITNSMTFLETYRYMSVPINCVFYILIVVCTVAAFDRYDVSKITKPCLLKACTLQSGAVAVLLYTAALCINVSMARMDDRLGPLANGTTDLERMFKTDGEMTRHISMWKVLGLVRAVFLATAWFVISLRPATDRLSKNLSNSEVVWGNKS